MPAMSTRKHTRLQTEERRAQLLEASLVLFTERSYDDVSIDDIAESAGVSKGLLYHYFGGKRALYVACVDLAASQLVDAVQPDPSLSPPVKALVGINAYLDFVEARSSVFRSLMQGGLGTDPEVARIVARTRGRFADQFLEGTGVDPSRPVFRFAARTYVGAVEAASLAWLEDGGVDRQGLVMTLMGVLHAVMNSAAMLDPDAGFEVAPETLSLISSLQAARP